MNSTDNSHAVLIWYPDLPRVDKPAKMPIVSLSVFEVGMLTIPFVGQVEFKARAYSFVRA